MSARLLLLVTLAGCRCDPEPVVPAVTPAPAPSAVASAAPAAAPSKVTYADLCARSTPAVPTTKALDDLFAELEPRLEPRGVTVLGAIRKPGVDPRQRGEILRAGALEQGLKACPLADLWERWARSDAG